MAVVSGLSCGTDPADADADCEELAFSWEAAAGQLTACTTSCDCAWVGGPTECDGPSGISIGGGFAVNAAAYPGSQAEQIEQQFADEDCPPSPRGFSVPAYVICEAGHCKPAVARSCGTAATCNPVTQQGCSATEKCTHQVQLEPDDPDPKAPLITRHSCFGCGEDDIDCSIAIGEPCQRRPASQGGIDSCVAGAVCRDGLCREICSTTPDTCAEGTCAVFDDLFEAVQGAGVCVL